MHALKFAIACVIHNLNIVLGNKKNKYLKDIPQIKSYKVCEDVEMDRFKSRKEKNNLIELLVIPVGWPEKHHKEHNIQLELNKINNEWIITQLILYYPSIMDVPYDFEVTNWPTYKLVIEPDEIKMRNAFRRHCDKQRSVGINPF